MTRLESAGDMKIYRNDHDEHRVHTFLKASLDDQSFRIFPLAGDASNRRYYRLVLENRSMVLMVWEPFTDEKDFPFLSVQRLFKLCGIAVPEVYKVDASLGLFLLEDLGDLTLERKFWETQDPSISEPFYLLALDELFKIHFVTSKAEVDCTAFKVKFDEEKLMWEMNYAREHLLEKLLGMSLSPIQAKEFASAAKSICKELAAISPVVCHRDYHSRNLMLTGGKIRVIDFQDARMGPPTYDLVSLLMDSYVEMDEPMKERLIAYYLDGARGHGHKFHPDHFREQFHLQSVQRCFKACGSFASFFNNKADRRYLKYLPGTIQSVRAALQETPSCRKLEELFEDLGLFHSSFDEI